MRVQIYQTQGRAALISAVFPLSASASCSRVGQRPVPTLAFRTAIHRLTNLTLQRLKITTRACMSVSSGWSKDWAVLTARWCPLLKIRPQGTELIMTIRTWAGLRLHKKVVLSTEMNHSCKTKSNVCLVTHLLEVLSKVDHRGRTIPCPRTSRRISRGGTPHHLITFLSEGKVLQTQNK